MTKTQHACPRKSQSQHTQSHNARAPLTDLVLRYEWLQRRVQLRTLAQVSLHLRHKLPESLQKIYPWCVTASILLNKADVVLHQGPKIRAPVLGKLGDLFDDSSFWGHEGAEHAANLLEASLQGPGEDKRSSTQTHANPLPLGFGRLTETHFKVRL